MEEPMGPWDNEFRAECHGCGVLMNVFSSAWNHTPDCPGLCVRPECTSHPKDLP